MHGVMTTCDITATIAKTDDGSVQSICYDGAVFVPERTCTVVSTIRHDYEGGYAGTCYEHELSCGHKTWWDYDCPPDWCPWCGAKVVDE